MTHGMIYTFDAGGENFTEDSFTIKYMRQGNSEYETGLLVNAGNTFSGKTIRLAEDIIRLPACMLTAKTTKQGCLDMWVICVVKEEELKNVLLDHSYIKGTGYAGGIVGVLSLSGQVRNNANYGKVNGTSGVGGVLAMINGSLCAADNNFNVGTVAGTGRDAGIVIGIYDGTGDVNKNYYLKSSSTLNGVGFYSLVQLIRLEMQEPLPLPHPHPVSVRNLKAVQPMTP